MCTLFTASQRWDQQCRYFNAENRVKRHNWQLSFVTIGGGTWYLIPLSGLYCADSDSNWRHWQIWLYAYLRHLGFIFAWWEDVAKWHPSLSMSMVGREVCSGHQLKHGMCLWSHMLTLALTSDFLGFWCVQLASVRLMRSLRCLIQRSC